MPTNHNDERSCTAHHDDPYEGEATVEPNGLTYLVMRCPHKLPGGDVCRRPRGLRLVRRNQAHYRMVDSRRMNEPLTTQAEAIDLLAERIGELVGLESKRAQLFTLLGVIRGCQQSLAALMTDNVPV